MGRKIENVYEYYRLIISSVAIVGGLKNMPPRTILLLQLNLIDSISIELLRIRALAVTS